MKVSDKMVVELIKTAEVIGVALGKARVDVRSATTTFDANAADEFCGFFLNRLEQTNQEVDRAFGFTLGMKFHEVVMAKSDEVVAEYERGKEVK